MSNAKTILGAALVLSGLLAVALVFHQPSEAAPARTFTSSQQCKECHPAVFEEWAGSQHAHSWLNPDVRALSNDFANTDCIGMMHTLPAYPRAFASLRGTTQYKCIHAANGMQTTKRARTGTSAQSESCRQRG